MCRKDQLQGACLLALGLGLLLGSWIDAQFWRICLGVSLLGAGVLVLVKK